VNARASLFLAVIKQSVRGLGGDCTEVRTSHNDERIVIQLVSPAGVVSQTTVWAQPVAKVPADDRQLMLPAFAAPVPPPSGFVYFILRDGMEAEQAWERLGDAALAWTSDAGGEMRMRTVVPAAFADQVRELAAEGIVGEGPSEGPSHLLRPGDDVVVNETPRKVCGVVAHESGDIGLVLDVDGVHRVAWLDGAAVENGWVRVWLSRTYATLGTDGAWRLLESAPKAPAKAKRAKAGS